jgi:hypothetical protein
VQVLVPKGKAVLITNDQEAEVVLPPGTIYRVKSVRESVPSNFLGQAGTLQRLVVVEILD